MRILVADPKPAEMQFLVSALCEKGYAVDIARTGAETLDRACGDDYDLLVIRSGFVDAELVELCRTLRSAGIGALILAVAGETSQDVVPALEAGADTCLAAPLALEELMAHVRALLRRRTGPAQSEK